MTSIVTSYSPAQIAGLSRQELESLTRADMAALNFSQIGALTTTEIEALAGTQLQALSTKQVTALAATQIRALTTSQIVFSAAQLAAFNATQVQSFEPEDIAALTTTQIKGLTARELTAMTSNQIDAFSATQIAAMNATQIKGFTATEVAGLDSQQFGALTAAEAWAWHRQMLAEHESLYDPRVAQRIRLGEAVSAADYIEMQATRQRFMRAVTDSLRGFDAVISPTAPIVAPLLEPLLASDEAFFATNALLLRNTAVINAIDGCAISLPCQASGELPVGLMLWSSAMRDDVVLDAALQVEAALAESRA